MVTIFPETRGGGAKDEKYAACQTQLAKEFLERGLQLSDASTVVDRLLPQAGLARVQRVLALSHPENRWQQLQALCRQFEVVIPVTPSRVQLAQQRVKAKAKARSSASQQNIKAGAFRLQEHFFRNADGSPAKVLHQVSPGCSGVVLLDPEEATPHLGLRTMDELGVFVLGHSCPKPDACKGVCAVPATNTLGEPVLLKACLHQLGDRLITFQCKHAADVATETAHCCAFTAYQDEWTDAEWGAMTANPVRKTLEIWRQVGVDNPFTSPWGRSLRDQVDSSSGPGCATLQFHARVCRSQLDHLLQKSGHNRIFVTPKNWTGELLSGFSVIWVPSGREELAAAAMGVKEQCGLVRSRNRLGVRVPDSAYEQAFKQLRPGATAPARLKITETFRLSGVPPGLRAEDVEAWSKAVSWPVRPLRPLGPRQWIVGASSDPPEGILSFNDQPVLVQHAAPKASRAPVVCAGRVPPGPTPAAAQQDDPWAQSDPWSKYLQKRRPTEASVAKGPSQLAAPTEERFREQGY